MHTLARHALLTLGTVGLLGLVGSVAGCGGDDNPYKPQPAWSGKKASLPARSRWASEREEAGL